ncbi:MAG: carbohydrate kinase [Leptolyngbya sp. SIOISBB]|nr:carbohydrate kinase [Leptolyngbya sp. SIOISBB]
MSHENTVICLGELLVDQVVDAQGNRQNFPGGAPANVAVALARLGLPVAFVGAVGTDDTGRHLIQVLQHCGVDCRWEQPRSAPTRIVEVNCTVEGDRTFGGFIGGATTDFADAHLAAQQLPLAALSVASVLVTGTLGLAYPATRAAMTQAAATLKASGGKLVIDVNWRPTFWPDERAALALLMPWLQQADLIKVAADEAMALWQTDDIAQLQAQFPDTHLLLTDGARGCQYAFAHHCGQVPAFSVSVVETTGAGDAFLAGMVYQGLQQSWRFETPDHITQAITFANALGALTTLKPGAITALPTATELLDFLYTHTGKVWTLGRV